MRDKQKLEINSEYSQSKWGKHWTLSHYFLLADDRDKHKFHVNSDDSLGEIASKLS